MAPRAGPPKPSTSGIGPGQARRTAHVPPMCRPGVSSLVDPRAPRRCPGSQGHDLRASTSLRLCSYGDGDGTVCRNPKCHGVRGSRRPTGRECAVDRRASRSGASHAAWVRRPTPAKSRAAGRSRAHSVPLDPRVCPTAFDSCEACCLQMVKCSAVRPMAGSTNIVSSDISKIYYSLLNTLFVSSNRMPRAPEATEPIRWVPGVLRWC